MSFGIWQLFQAGGPVMWVLLVTSLVALSVIIDRVSVFVWSHQRLEFVLDRLGPLIRAGDWDEASAWCHRRGSLMPVASAYVQHRDQPAAIREDIVRREGLIVLGRLDHGLRWLAVLAQVSTLLGLLGTFHVMIVRFHEGELSGAQVQPAQFSSAIWEALLTTMYGLLIAIPCSAVYQVLEGRVDAVSRQMDILVSCLEQWRREAATQNTGAVTSLPMSPLPSSFAGSR
jgi:biopolymer transport protein ExbB